jgi:hypothetical protein
MKRSMRTCPGTATRACPGALMAIDVAQKVVEAFLPSVAGKVAEL